MELGAYEVLSYQQQAQRAQFQLRRQQAMIERCERARASGFAAIVYQGSTHDTQRALGVAESMKRYWSAQLVNALNGMKSEASASEPAKREHA